MPWKRRGRESAIAAKLKLLTGERGGSRTTEWTLEVALASMTGRRSELWHPFVTRIAMSPGEHRARLVVQTVTTPVP